MVGDRGRIRSVNNSSLNSHKLTRLLKSDFTPMDRTVGGRSVVDSLLKNQNLHVSVV